MSPVGTTCRLKFLGGAALLWTDPPTDPRAASPCQLALLALRGTRPDARCRKRLAALLWPDAAESRARHPFSGAVYFLRNAIGYDAVHVAGPCRRLACDRISSDAGAFERAGRVRNTGTRDGDEVVQLYLKDVLAPVARPVMELRGFQRIRMAAGEARDVTLRVPVRELRFLDAGMRWGVEPGEYRVLVGSSAREIRVRGGFVVRQESRRHHLHRSPVQRAVGQAVVESEVVTRANCPILRHGAATRLPTLRKGLRAVDWWRSGSPWGG